EIRYDLDRPLNIEFLERLIQQVFRNCRNSVALFDGKLGDGQIRTVAADERDIRSVQRGDKRQAARRGHRTRKQRTDRMRNSVMDVKQVQRLRFKNFKHLGGERQCIRWMVKEGIGRHLNLVKKDVRV